MENFEPLILPLIAVAVVGYLLGSISSAIILTRLFAHEDVRTAAATPARPTCCVLRAKKRPR